MTNIRPINPMEPELPTTAERPASSASQAPTTAHARHTPGPWFVGTGYTDDEGYVELPIQAEIDGTIATPAAVCLQFPHVTGMQEANAHLIAAAPDLLAALCQLATVNARSDLDIQNNRPTEAEYRAAMRAAESAIAKAIGSAA